MNEMVEALLPPPMTRCLSAKSEDKQQLSGVSFLKGRFPPLHLSNLFQGKRERVRQMTGLTLALSQL